VPWTVPEQLHKRRIVETQSVITSVDGIVMEGAERLPHEHLMGQDRCWAAEVGSLTSGCEGERGVQVMLEDLAADSYGDEFRLACKAKQKFCG
jgi:hypothetical protein